MGSESGASFSWKGILGDPGYRAANALLALLALLILLSIYGLAARIVQGVGEERQQVLDDGQRVAALLDHELEVPVYNLMAMDLLAQRLLRGQAGGAEDPVARELAMARGLTPLMQALRERMPDRPSVHYVSAQQFLFLFPGEGGGDVVHRPGLQSMEYYAGATPAANPDRKTFWTRPYREGATEDWRLSASRPLYVDGAFLGALGVNVPMTSLQRLLDAHPVAHARVRLVGHEGQVLASTGAAPDSTVGALEDSDGIALSNAPWQFSMRIDRWALIDVALRKRILLVLSVVVLASSYLVLIVIVRGYRRNRALSLIDALTGVPNRRYFDEVLPTRLGSARRGACRLGFLILDVDHFKTYNDSYGHQQGDRALQAVAAAVSEVLRRQADQVFRVGGEEFAVVVPLGKDEGIEAVAQSIQQAVRDLRLRHACNPPGVVTVSIGATVIDRQHPADLGLAHRKADEALYLAKEGGRDRCVVLPIEP